MSSFLQSNNFKYTTLNDLLKSKLKNLNDLSPEISEDRRSSSNTSVIHFSSELKEKGNKMYSANIHKFNTIMTPKANSPMGSHNNVMKMIRGGGGGSSHCFFNKMLDNNEEACGMMSKNELDRFRRDKLEKELKYLDSEELGNSKDSDSIEVSCFTMADTGNQESGKKQAEQQLSEKKNKGSIWKTLAKIITK
jgi:hypothetical protein